MTSNTKNLCKIYGGEDNEHLLVIALSDSIMYGPKTIMQSVVCIVRKIGGSISTVRLASAAAVAACVHPHHYIMAVSSKWKWKWFQGEINIVLFIADKRERTLDCSTQVTCQFRNQVTSFEHRFEEVKFTKNIRMENIVQWDHQRLVRVGQLGQTLCGSALDEVVMIISPRSPAFTRPSHTRCT